MENQNLLFGDAVRFEGILRTDEGMALVTSQPFISLVVGSRRAYPSPMAERLPPWVTSHEQHRRRAEFREYAGMPVEERWRRFLEAEAWSWILLSQNPHRERALERREARSPEAMALWRRLMDESSGR